MNNRIFYTCTFTGHRNVFFNKSKLLQIINYIKIKLKLIKNLKEIINQGYTHFITGMAIGTDLLFAEIIIAIKNKNPNIHLECAIPCFDQCKYWSKFNIYKYKKILARADKITYVSQNNYFKGCMFKRNKYMVDKANLVIAIYNGNNGGTKQTLEYAKSLNKKIIIISS